MNLLAKRTALKKHGKFNKDNEKKNSNMYFLYVRLELDFRKRLNNIVPFIAHYTIAWFLKAPQKRSV